MQVTNLGITVKDSPLNTLVFVTRLDTGAPVPGARVALISRENKVLWEETTGADGAVIAPGSPRSKFWDFEFIVVAEKDGDTAYLGSDWHEGIGPWDFGYALNLREAQPVLRGTVFSDRGVYRLGEEVHFKTILRSDTPSGMKLLIPGTLIDLSTHDSQGKEIDKRTVKIGEWSSAEWTLKLPADGALGTYQIVAKRKEDAIQPKSDSFYDFGRIPDVSGQLSRRSLPAPRFSRRRDAWRRLFNRRRIAYRHGDGPLFVRLRNGQAQSGLASHTRSLVLGARRDSRTLYRCALRVCGRLRWADGDRRGRERRDSSGCQGSVHGVVGDAGGAGPPLSVHV